jgi:acetolactate synthase I/II/III large subunit
MARMKVTGAQLMARTLREAGIDVVSGIPGHTVVSLAQAVGQQDGLRPFLVRHEGIATFAADVYYRISGRLMAAFTHTFPGTTNALSGVANAYADSSAMLLITGETAGAALGRGAYQELSRQFDGDNPQLVRHAVKRLWQPRSALDLVDKTMLAVRTATTGRPGPVALSVFQEIWDEEVDIPGWPSADGYLFDTAARPRADAVEQLHRALSGAERPVIVAGNGVNLARARAELLAVAERYQVPVVTTVTGKGAFPDEHRLSLGVVGWVGTSAANYATREADLVVALGARLTETTSSSWQPGITFDFDRSSLFQVDADPDAIANFYPVDGAVVGDARLTLLDLMDAAEDGRPMQDRSAWLQRVQREREEWAAVAAQSRVPGTRGQIGVGAVVQSMRQALTGPVNLVCDVGKHHKWVVQQFDAREDDYVINSVAAGTMGIGPAGAVGAALARPEARTIAWTGDGGMSMSLPVWPTVAEHRLPITYVVADDRAYGAVANIQHEQFGETVFSEFHGGGTNPGYSLDLAAVAQACGIPSRRVEDPAELDDAFAWAGEQEGPNVLDVMIDRSSVVPSGGGRYLHALWENRPTPWARERQVE